MLEGLVEFRDKYTGRFWLEVFLLSDVTTVEAKITIAWFLISNLISPL
jgi:wyosine [tRNA(Phe)-imidazoG37] synthetase (radical SAM superfamily)